MSIGRWMSESTFSETLNWFEEGSERFGEILKFRVSILSAGETFSVHVSPNRNWDEEWRKSGGLMTTGDNVVGIYEDLEEAQVIALECMEDLVTRGYKFNFEMSEK
jgi:hypothetical protein